MSDEYVEACLKLPVNELKMRYIDRYLDVDYLRACSISHLNTCFSITATDVEEIIQMWKSRKGLWRWKFECTFHVPQFTNIFNAYEVLPFDYSDPIDRSRPLAFKKVDDYFDEITFYLLREDGLVFFVSHRVCSGNIDEGRITFKICRIIDSPPALREL